MRGHVDGAERGQLAAVQVLVAALVVCKELAGCTGGVVGMICSAALMRLTCRQAIRVDEVQKGVHKDGIQQRAKFGLSGGS